MIQGIGTDIVSIARIENAMKNPAFVDRILTKKEQRRNLTAEYVAGRWAAKEAIKKCLPHLNKWHQVEVIGISGHPPQVRIHHPATDPTHLHVHLSISHERDIAIAFAVVEKFS
ncbi:MAG: holo-ACP synthase [Fimbriimonadaceae bacterium]